MSDANLPANERIARAIDERSHGAVEAARILLGDDGMPPSDDGPLPVLNGMIHAYREAARLARETPEAGTARSDRLRDIIGRAAGRLEIDDIYPEVATGAIPIGLPAEHYRSMVDFLARSILEARSILSESARIARETSPWIAVGDGLPATPDDVYALWTDGPSISSYRYANSDRRESERFWESISGCPSGHVTHWFQLPTLPNGGIPS